MNAMFTAWTVLVCVIFAGIVVWAWSRARKQEFDAAARIPIDDDDTNDARTEVR